MPNYILGLSLRGNELDVLEDALQAYENYCRKQSVDGAEKEYAERLCLLQAIKLKLFDNVTLTADGEADAIDVTHFHLK